MLRRYFQLFLIFWISIWFGIIMPTHQRGRYGLPGKDAVPSFVYGATCCQFSRPSKGPAKDAPQEGGPGRCLICYLTASLSTPPVYYFAVIFLHRTPIVASTWVQQRQGVTYIASKRSRAPPHFTA